MLTAMRAKAPSKLVLTGEYAVLEPGAQAVVAALDRWTKATVEPSDQLLLTSSALELAEAPARFEDGRWKLDMPHAQAGVVSEALTVTMRYLEESGRVLEPFHLRLSPALAEDGVKIGLGGSASATVATVAAVLAAMGHEAEPEGIYRLAAIAHLRAQGSGSGIDVAASTYGGLLAFSSHLPSWLMRRIAEEPTVRAVVEGPWPHLRIEPLDWPEGWDLLVGWTGTSASTPELLGKVRHLKEQGDPRYLSFLTRMQESSRHLMAALKEHDPSLALDSLRLGRDAMQSLGHSLGLALETPKLARLAEAALAGNSAGKPSGAGGGDCGIAIAFDPSQADGIRRAWRQAGITPLPLGLAPTGVTISPA